MLSFYCRSVVTTNDLKLLLNSTCQNFSNQSMSTILDRSARAHTILADIRAILQDVPLGKYKIQAVLQLRESMFVNGVLFNSKVWQGLYSADIKMLETVDHQLMKIYVMDTPKRPVNSTIWRHRPFPSNI